MSKLVSNSRWFVIRTNPRCESRARRSLIRSGFGVYLPISKIERQHRRSKCWSTTAHPLMPGYLFLDMAGSDDWFGLRRCDGVAAVLGAADNRGEMAPFPVPSRLVERLMAAQLEMRFDDTREARVRRKEQGRTDRDETLLHLPLGSHVRIAAGPFASFPAEVSGVDQRGMVEALVAIFGRLTPVTVPPSDIERMAA